MPASGASPMVAVAVVDWVRKDKDALKEAREERGKRRGGRAKEEERKRWASEKRTRKLIMNEKVGERTKYLKAETKWH